MFVCVCVCVCEYAPPCGLSTPAKEFTAVARIIQSSSNELSTQVSGTV